MKGEFSGLREGLPILTIVGLATLVLGAAGFWVAAAVGAILLGFAAYFFRDPKRVVVPREGNILSPADGTVATVCEAEENRFLKGRCQKVGIFMSIFNVHVNRAPVSGRVRYIAHEPGRYLNALRESAAEQNECNFLGIEGDGIRVLVRQIAGVIARRIVCRCQTDDVLEQGQKFGMIKFGSRVEVYLPLECRVVVRKGDKVEAGKTLLGEYHAKG